MATIPARQVHCKGLGMLPLRVLAVVGVWALMAVSPALRYFYFNGRLNLSLSDNYLLSVYLYALGFMLYRVIVEPRAKKVEGKFVAEITHRY